MNDLDALIRENKPLVYLVINRDFPEYAMDDDVIQEGMIGLWYAAKAYDPAKAKFSTLAVPAIRNNIGMYLRKQKQANIVSLDDDECLEAYHPRDSFEYVDLRGWISTLNPVQQHVVCLRLEGMSMKDVSKVIGCTHQNVSFMLKRCRGSFEKYI